LISQVTDAVIEEAKIWQNRALEAIYGIVYLDALYIKMRHEGRVENRAVYVALGVDMEGHKDVLGLWASGNEGAKFWLGVLTELRNRGVKDMLIVCVDGLKGFPQAIEAVFPLAQIQLCIVHLVRASLNYVNWKGNSSGTLSIFLDKSLRIGYRMVDECENGSPRRAIKYSGE